MNTTQGRAGWWINRGLGQIRRVPETREEVIRHIENYSGRTDPEIVYETEDEALFEIKELLRQMFETARYQQSAYADPVPEMRDWERTALLEREARNERIARAGFRLLAIDNAERYCEENTFRQVG
jgi:hypothetical protein